MSKVTKSANQEYCTVRLPGVCSHDPATTVFAHIAGVRLGHGVGIKTKLGAYACNKCHDVADGRTPRPQWLSAEDVKLAHLEGMAETLLKLEEKGLVKL